MKRVVLSSVLSCLLLCSAASAQIIINEAFTGTPDHIELYNCSQAAFDVSGWTVTTAYATSGVTTTVEQAFTIPAGTIIPGGGFLILEEFGTAGAPGTLPNSIAVGFNYFWVANRDLEVALTDQAGTNVDYMYRNPFGSTPSLQTGGAVWTTATLNSGTGDTIERITDFDTNDSSDWATSTAAATTAALNPAQVLPICGAPSPTYETNDAAGSLDIDGVQTPGFFPARTSVATGVTSTVTLSSNVAGNFFETVINLAPLVPAGTPPAIVTGGSQFINIDLTAVPTIYLNGGAAPSFGPFPGLLALPISTATPTNFSAQAFFTDPSNADGVAISQGVEYESQNFTAAGPTSDDGTVLIDLAAAGLPDVTFAGMTYSTVGVNSNGRLTMGGVDGDFSATTAEASTDIPNIGYWTDFNPSVAGTITVSDDGNLFVVDYSGVSYFGENTASTFSISYDRGAATWSIGGLTGIVPNPTTTATTSDGIFFGYSPGSAATGGTAVNTGSIVFGIGGSGVTTSADEMIFEEFLSTAAVAGTPNIAASLAAGTLNQVDFTDAGGGITLWVGL